MLKNVVKQQNGTRTTSILGRYAPIDQHQNQQLQSYQKTSSQLASPLDNCQIILAKIGKKSAQTPTAGHRHPGRHIGLSRYADAQPRLAIRCQTWSSLKTRAEGQRPWEVGVHMLLQANKQGPSPSVLKFKITVISRIRVPPLLHLPQIRNHHSPPAHRKLHRHWTLLVHHPQHRFLPKRCNKNYPWRNRSLLRFHDPSFHHRFAPDYWRAHTEDQQLCDPFDCIDIHERPLH